MGLFSKLFKKDSAEEIQQETTQQEETKQVEQPAVINMSKHQENLDKVIINMSKGSKIDMSKHTARVALAMDYSGSMRELYYSGDVQDVITRLLPIALKFDDNGELESWLFSTQCDGLPAVNINNYKGYVDKVMLKSRMLMGGTRYAPVLEEIVKYYKDKHPSDIPAFVMFITDGENSDPRDTENVIRELSKYNMFVQFVGIGNENFNFLKKLDDLSGRKTDNTGFIRVKDMSKLSDEELYTEMLRQYKDWLNKR